MSKPIKYEEILSLAHAFQYLEDWSWFETHSFELKPLGANESGYLSLGYCILQNRREDTIGNRVLFFSENKSRLIRGKDEGPPIYEIYMNEKEKSKDDKKITVIKNTSGNPYNTKEAIQMGEYWDNITVKSDDDAAAPAEAAPAEAAPAAAAPAAAAPAAAASAAAASAAGMGGRSRKTKRKKNRKRKSKGRRR